MKSIGPEEASTTSDVVDTIDTVTQVVVMIATAYVAVRSAMTADQLVSVKANALKYLEGYCQRRAAGWAHAADACMAAYEKSRNVW